MIISSSLLLHHCHYNNKQQQQQLESVHTFSLVPFLKGLSFSSFVDVVVLHLQLHHLPSSSSSSTSSSSSSSSSSFSQRKVTLPLHQVALARRTASRGRSVKATPRFVPFLKNVSVLASMLSSMPTTSPRPKLLP